VSGRSRAESQVGVRLMGVWRVSYSNIQEIFFLLVAGRDVYAACVCARRPPRPCPLAAPIVWPSLASRPIWSLRVALLAACAPHGIQLQLRYTPISRTPTGLQPSSFHFHSLQISNLPPYPPLREDALGGDASD
jgi:hypothetical protein